MKLTTLNIIEQALKDRDICTTAKYELLKDGMAAKYGRDWGISDLSQEEMVKGETLFVNKVNATRALKDFREQER